MPVAIDCPRCRTRFNLGDQQRGKRVRCRVCEETFTVPHDDLPEVLPADPDEQLQAGPEPNPHRSRRRADRDRDERLAPARRPRRDVAGGSGSGPALLIGAAVGGLCVLVALVGGAVWMFSGPSAAPNAGPAVAVAAPDAAGIAAAPNAVAPVPAAPGGAAPAGPARSLRYRWQGAPHVYAVSVSLERDDHLEVHRGSCVVHVRPGGAAQAQPAERKATGTGFVVNADGYLVTCAHVVADATRVEVAIGGRALAGTVLAVDHDHDLAVVQVPARGLPTVLLADSNRAELGQEVRALGFPLSSVLGDNIKVTRGTLSGINQRDGRKVFQVDASINAGNSGGPLVGEDGAVLGVNSAKLAGAAVSNVGFATPSNEAARLLRGKGVTFTTAAAGPKLDGPALVRRVSPAVALVTVTLGPGAAADTYQLTCSGALVKSQQGKPGVAFLPRPPSFGPVMPQSSRIDMDATGKVLRAQAGTQLPALLGDVGLFLVEPLPPDGRATWQTEGTCTLEQSSGGGFPFGPRFMPRGPRFGPRFGAPPGARQTTTRQAVEKATYTRGAANGDTVTIRKRYELKADPTAAAPALTLTGDGDITFDARVGLPRTIEFKGALAVGNGRLPITASYRLLEGAERDRALNPPPPPKVDPPAFTDADLTQALADLKSTDAHRRRVALGRLKAAKPTARRAEVAKALGEVLSDKDGWTRRDCLQALAVWATSDNVTQVLPLVADADVFTRGEAIATLGKIGDARAAEPIAKRLPDNFDRGKAVEALKALGSKAEKAVVPYLSHADWVVRMEACNVLEAIGTRESKAALDKAAGDSNGLVAMRAKRAAEAAAKRP